MYLSIAILNLKQLDTPATYTLDEDNIASIQLGIEALKWVKRYRPDNKTDRWSLLPGETKE